ncbi:AMIN-like domain-containing (lipo)protein [Pseudokineococcus marinus]|uniref:AMIN-like domain-containing (lipo)protein n=1 Tax=Pseudokineococcus marinus TaxID=351215 RepID=UPI001487C143|nr:hypothetical protein [Pseudokineococcus marinus]
MRSARSVVAALAAAGLVLTGVVAAAGPAAAAPYCGIRWGSLPERAGDLGPGSVRDVRAGRHACFDRLVVDVDGDAGGYVVSYVDVVRAPGSGARVPLRGGAALQVVVQVPTYDRVDGSATYDPADARELVDVAGYRTFRQAALAGSFEGTTDLGLGVRARLPFRAFVLDGPGDGSRVVVDVAHRW